MFLVECFGVKLSGNVFRCGLHTLRYKLPKVCFRNSKINVFCGAHDTPLKIVTQSAHPEKHRLSDEGQFLESPWLDPTFNVSI